VENIKVKNFTELSKEEILKVYKWRNDLRIRKYMLDSEEFSEEDYFKLIENLKKSKEWAFFLVEDVGVIDFINICEINESAELGLYSNPDKFGVGNILMNEILNFPYKKLYLKVFSNNDKAIKLYKRFDFKETKREITEKGELIFMELNR
jgi:UDP-4-amino-4,6-dideoxy-N-acetyl-beta-L-altrosamine N-acetyltransferase